MRNNLKLFDVQNLLGHPANYSEAQKSQVQLGQVCNLCLKVQFYSFCSIIIPCLGGLFCMTPWSNLSLNIIPVIFRTSFLDKDLLYLPLFFFVQYIKSDFLVIELLKFSAPVDSWIMPDGARARGPSAFLALEPLFRHIIFFTGVCLLG